MSIHFNNTTFIQSLKLIRSLMPYNTQTYISNKSYTSNISTTTTINDHTTYLILDLTSSMENILSLLLHIIFFNSNTQSSPYHHDLPLMCIFNITIIHKWWHIITIRRLTSRFNLFIIPQNHDSLICIF